MKTLGQIARKIYNYTLSWESVAAAVVAAHEARRWQSWPPCVDGELPSVVALDDPIAGRKFALLSNDRWFDEAGDMISNYVNPPKRWSPIPAPPQEADDAQR